MKIEYVIELIENVREFEEKLEKHLEKFPGTNWGVEPLDQRRYLTKMFESSVLKLGNYLYKNRIEFKQILEEVKRNEKI